MTRSIKETLDRFEVIVRDGLLTHGAYCEGFVVDENLIDAPCGGNRMCAVGSLFVAFGLGKKGDDGGIELQDAEPIRRGKPLGENPKLFKVYHALNDAAGDYARENDIDLDDCGIYSGNLETLFESGLPRLHGTYDTSEEALPEERDVLLDVIERAKRKLLAA